MSSNENLGIIGSSIAVGVTGMGLLWTIQSYNKRSKRGRKKKKPKTPPASPKIVRKRQGEVESDVIKYLNLKGETLIRRISESRDSSDVEERTENYFEQVREKKEDELSDIDDFINEDWVDLSTSDDLHDAHDLSNTTRSSS